MSQKSSNPFSIWKLAILVFCALLFFVIGIVAKAKPNYLPTSFDLYPNDSTSVVSQP